MSIALISGNLKLQQTSSPAQLFTGTVFLFTIFCVNFTALFFISFVISGIYKAVSVYIMVFDCVTSYSLVIIELSEEITVSGFRVYFVLPSMCHYR